MNHHIAWIVIQEEHRARHAHAEKYGIHDAELRREERRKRRVWAFPRLRRRTTAAPAPTAATPVVGTPAPSPIS